MKTIIYLITALFILPAALSLMGGESYDYHFDKCDYVQVVFGGLDAGESNSIIRGVERCVFSSYDRVWVCDCEDNADVTVVVSQGAGPNSVLSVFSNYDAGYNEEYYKRSTFSTLKTIIGFGSIIIVFVVVITLIIYVILVKNNPRKPKDLYSKTLLLINIIQVVA